MLIFLGNPEQNQQTLPAIGPNKKTMKTIVSHLKLNRTHDLKIISFTQTMTIL